MTRPTPLYIVCSPSPRAGVTTTARLLTDYHLGRGVVPSGFDTDPHAPRYAELFPGQAQAVDLAEMRGQIALFDSLLAQDGAPRIVDVWHRAYERFFAIARDIGFFEETRAAGVEPIILFQADAFRRAPAAAQALRDAWPALTMVVVHNEGAAPLGDNAAAILENYPLQRKFVIPALENPVGRLLDIEDISFSEFLAAPPPEMSLVVRNALRRWLIPIFMQFHSFELRLDFECSEYLG